jgi:hypothetical protein
VFLRQNRKDFFCAVEILPLIRPTQDNDYFVKIIYVLKLTENSIQGRRTKFGRRYRQHQSNRSVAIKLAQIVFHPPELKLPQTMKSWHHSRLTEISHVSLLSD